MGHAVTWDYRSWQRFLTVTISLYFYEIIKYCVAKWSRRTSENSRVYIIKWVNHNKWFLKFNLLIHIIQSSLRVNDHINVKCHCWAVNASAVNISHSTSNYNELPLYEVRGCHMRTYCTKRLKLFSLTSSDWTQTKLNSHFTSHL